MNSTTLILSRIGLTADKVRSMLGRVALPVAPRQVRRREVAPRKGNYPNRDRITAWLSTAKRGDQVDRNTLGILQNSSTGAFAPFVKSGQLRIVHPPHQGPYGRPTLYAKV
jgi:hypothetical protein